jgi:hypothetical protein
MVDPLEVVIAYVKTKLSSSVGDRVASKQRFNEAWEVDQSALRIRQDGGNPDLYSQVSNIRVEVSMYGKDTPTISRLWGELVALTRQDTRDPVVITDGSTALLLSFNQDSGLSFLFDEDLSSDYGMAFFSAIVAEEEVL